MREIKFRGKSLKTGRWVYGSLISCDKYTDIWTANEDGNVARDEVDPETVGQFTGLYDKDGEEIYEGDIVQFGQTILNVVEFRHGAFGYEYCVDFHSYCGNTNFCFNPRNTDHRHKVVGNIHDNPELINN